MLVKIEMTEQEAQELSKSLNQVHQIKEVILFEKKLDEAIKNTKKNKCDHKKETMTEQELKRKFKKSIVSIVGAASEYQKERKKKYGRLVSEIELNKEVMDKLKYDEIAETLLQRFTQKKLEITYYKCGKNMSDKEIAELYGVTPSHIGDLVRQVLLHTAHIAKFHVKEDV